MPADRGKEWEGLFKDICENSGIDCVRFHDVTQRFKDVDNPADFTISKDLRSWSWLIECKATNGTSWSLNFRQYKDLIKFTRFNSQVLIWFVQYKEVWALNINIIKELRESGVKSFNPRKFVKAGHARKGIDRIDADWARIKPKTLDFRKLWENQYE